MASGIQDDEEVRRINHEIALEVKSLRRIISAYLNYPEAAEEDVRRNERSFERLPPAHKALLSHLPFKFQKLRWCISKNSFFIFEMLKTFEPPLDLSQDVCISENDNQSNVSNSHLLSGEKNYGSSELCLADGTVSLSKNDGPQSDDVVCRSSKEMRNKQFNEINAGSSCICSENKGDHICPNNEATFSSNLGCNGNVMSSPPDWLDPSLQSHVPLVDVDKVRCIIRNIVRDWASEGQKERDQCYKPILEELQKLFPHRGEESPPACLVPGAGLGRLALEISRLGFMCQGNEFSYYMMICSSFILNHAQTAEEWTIYPWIHSNCNSLSDSDQLRPVSIPDIHPASAGATEGFSMCGGDFVEVYSDPSHADMYGQEDEMSIELSLEDVKKVAFHYGFELEQSSTIETTYTTNPRSMMQNRYYAAFWTMRKSMNLKQEGLL